MTIATIKLHMGRRGPTGADGPTGPEGDTGPIGLTGEQGIQGEPGTDALDFRNAPVIDITDFADLGEGVYSYDAAAGGAYLVDLSTFATSMALIALPVGAADAQVAIKTTGWSVPGVTLGFLGATVGESPQTIEGDVNIIGGFTAIAPSSPADIRTFLLTWNDATSMWLVTSAQSIRSVTDTGMIAGAPIDPTATPDEGAVLTIVSGRATWVVPG